MDLFLSLRDLSTRYGIPGPHGCVTALKPFGFSVVGEGYDQRIVVTQKWEESEYQGLTPEASKINLGDELLAVDRTPIMQYLWRRRLFSGWATESGALRASLEKLTKISGKWSRMPSQNETHYEFMSEIGIKYKVTVPWIARYNAQCWDESQGFIRDKLKNRKRPHSNISTLEKREIEKETKLEWLIHKPETKNLGVIFFPSFRQNFRTTLNAIQSLLANELKDTNAVIFDVRGAFSLMNPLADLIPQLFARDVNTTYSRALHQPTMLELLTKSNKGGKWDNAYKGVNFKYRYSKLVQMTTNEDANRLGQVYVKPVGVFTNGLTIWGCEVFAANMQDNNVGLIFGEDEFTGGSGGDLVAYDTLTMNMPGLFPAVPLKDQLPNSSQNFVVAWRQMLRINGTLIENRGVQSDYIVRPVVADLIHDATSNTQYDRIADTLIRHGIKTGQDKLYFQVEPQTEFDVAFGNPVTFTIDTKGYSSISLFDATGSLLATVDSDPTVRLKQKLEYEVERKEFSVERFNIKGFDAAGKVTFSTWRTIRFVPGPSEYLQYTQGMTIDVKSKQKHLGTFKTIGQGWTNLENRWKMVDGMINFENENSMRLFVSSDKESRIKVRAQYNTQSSFDRFQIGFFQGPDVKIILFDVSGTGSVDKSFRLRAGQLEVFFRFVSDRDGELFDVYSIDTAIESLEFQ